MRYCLASLLLLLLVVGCSDTTDTFSGGGTAPPPGTTGGQLVRGAVVYESGGQLIQVDRLGGSRRVLTQGSQPTLEPRGNGLIFTRGEELYRLDASGQALPLGAGSQAQWSPDGGLVTFSLNGDIWVMNPDGSGRRPLVTGPENDTWPGLSRDHVYFERQGQIMRATRAELSLRGEATPLASGSTPVVWGNRVAFVQGGDVWAMNRDGSGQRNLTNSAVQESHPAASQDARSLHFLADGDVRVTNADGSQSRTVTSGAGATNLATASNDILPMSSFAFAASPYNLDGTNPANPVIAASPLASGGYTFLRQQLTSNSTVTFAPSPGGSPSTYTVYSSVPDYMTVNVAYSQNVSRYWDANSIANNSIPLTPPAGLINGGQASTLLGAGNQTSWWSGEPVNVYANPSPAPSGSPGFNYMVPCVQGLTDNVVWCVDPYYGVSNATVSSESLKPHVIASGWANPAVNAQQTLFFNSLGADGGSLLSSVNLATQTLNQLVEGILGLYNLATISQTQAQSAYPWYTMPEPSPNSGTVGAYPPNWLSYGEFQHLQPKPGFQRNLLRQGTPWGSYTALQSTSGLFVRTDGSVEVPLQPGTTTPYPLVTQTWDGSQRYTILNNLTKLVASTTDDYPGFEYYFLGNTYLPGTAGLMTPFTNYLVWDNASTDSPRNPDNWLGLAGDPVETALSWTNANNVEPGGQARKPFLFDTRFPASPGSSSSLFTYQHANSFGVVPYTTTTNLNSQLYNCTVYVNFNAYGTQFSLPSGWQQVCTLNWTLANLVPNFGANPTWTASNTSAYYVANASWDYTGQGNQGSSNTQVALPAGMSISLKAQQASNWSAPGTNGNVITWNGNSAFAITPNVAGGGIYYYILTVSLPDPSIQVLVVLH